jgi:hypothetical protein
MASDFQPVTSAGSQPTTVPVLAFHNISPDASYYARQFSQSVGVCGRHPKQGLT